MKAKPVKLIKGVGYELCDTSEDTHVKIRVPGPSGIVILPVITKGSRSDSGCWTWNGSVDMPTLKPSVLTEDGVSFRCHTWITDGNATFLGDTSHELRNQTIDLLDV